MCATVVADGDGIVCATVDSFQGAERVRDFCPNRVSMHGRVAYIVLDAANCFERGQEIIIISTVRSSGIGFIDSPHRYNVALTRARRHILVVGNAANLRSNPLWSALLDHAAHFPNLESVLELIGADPSAEYALVLP